MQKALLTDPGLVPDPHVAPVVALEDGLVSDVHVATKLNVFRMEDQCTLLEHTGLPTASEVPRAKRSRAVRAVAHHLRIACPRPHR